MPADDPRRSATHAAAASGTRGCWRSALLLGAAALTRNEAVWLARSPGPGSRWRLPGRPRVERLRLIGVVAAVASPVFAPWAVRNWRRLRQPAARPGDLQRALASPGFDIFAWNDPPTLARYLAVGPAELLEMRVTGLGHNLVNVLLLLGFPIVRLGLLALPVAGAADRALRPVVLVGVAHVPRHEPRCSRWPPPGARSSTPRRPSTCC